MWPRQRQSIIVINIIVSLFCNIGIIAQGDDNEITHYDCIHDRIARQVTYVTAPQVYSQNTNPPHATTPGAD
jgi:hypothetical protein